MKKLFIFIVLASFSFFLLFQVTHIPAGDSGDLATAAAVWGVAHPPGFPLYTFLSAILADIPIQTVAWRVSLMSSIPSALSLGFIFFIVYRITKNRIAAFIPVLFALGNYPLLTFSIIPEVFGLATLFSVLIIYTMMLWYQTHNERWFVLSCVFLVFGVTHHPILILFMPACMVFTYVHKNLLQTHSIKKAAAWSVFGFLPYLYVPLAAIREPIINWEHAVNIKNFITLISRARYGTFQSAVSIGNTMFERLLNIKAYGNLVLEDFQVIGILLILFGFYWLWSKTRDLFWFFFAAFLTTGPLYFFYASYRLTNRFVLGTIEKFLLSSYVVLFILAGVGLYQIIIFFARRKILRGILIVAVCIQTGILISSNVYRFWGIADDTTAEILAADILDSLPKHAIYFVSGDTQLFTSWYMRYAIGYRPDIYLIYSGSMAEPDYFRTIEHNFPELKIPSYDSETMVLDFMNANITDHEIYAYTELLKPDGYSWVPYGLMYKLYKDTDLPTYEKILEDNNTLWSRYRYKEASSGILLRYNHLLLADVKSTYSGASLDFAKLFVESGFPNEMVPYLDRVISLGNDLDVPVAFKYLGIVYLNKGDCQKALDNFSKSESSAYVPDYTILQLKAVTYKNCLKDDEKAEMLFKQYEHEKAKYEIPLE